MSRNLFTRRLLPSFLRLFAAFTQFFATLIIARTLGDVDASPFFFWSSIMMSVAVFSTFGLDRLLLQQTPTLDNDPDGLASLVAGVRSLVIAVSLAFGVLVALYALFTDNPTSGNLYWTLFLPLGVAGIALCRTNAEALKGMAHPNLAIIHRQLIAGIGFLVLLMLFLPVLNANLAIAMYVLCFLITGIGAHKYIGFRDLGVGYSRIDVKTATKYLKAGLPICIGSFFYSLAMIIPLAILERTGPPEAVSHLTTTYRIFILINLLAVAAYASDLPALARAGKDKLFDQTLRIYLKMIVATCAIFIIPVFLVIFFSEYVMTTFGSDFVAAVDVLKIFMYFIIVSLVLGPTDDLLLMQNQTTVIALSSALKLLVVIVVGVYLIPRYDAAGMAITIGIGIVVQKLFSLLMWWRKASIS